MKIEAAVICGDGVGPEMMGAALSALKAVCKKYHHVSGVCLQRGAGAGEGAAAGGVVTAVSGGSGSAVWQYRIGKIPG